MIPVESVAVMRWGVKVRDLVGMGVLSVVVGAMLIPVAFLAFILYGPLLIDSHGSCHLWLLEVHAEELPGTVLSIYSDEEHCIDVILSATEVREGFAYRPFHARKGRSQLTVVCGGKVVARTDLFVTSDDNYFRVPRVPEKAPESEAGGDGS